MKERSANIHLIGKSIKVNDDTWSVINVGAENDDGLVMMHLASTTRFRQQRNGRVPYQMADWFAPELAI